MKINSLKIQGFKSFSNHTLLEFDHGITAIVGPNGSGKSNILEAIRWVLGEQSHSLLRSKRSEDVIWAGSPGKPRAGMAEVEISIDNHDKSIPLPYEEISITRRAYRSGENEYLINGRKARLRDVQEIGAIIGESFTFINQGSVDEVLLISPEHRTVLLEQAADITHHFKRRDETLKRLAEVEDNLRRVEDLLNDSRPRLKSLIKQVNNLRSKEVEEEKLRQLLEAYYSRQIQDLESQIGSARHRKVHLQNRRDQILDRLPTLESQKRLIEQDIEKRKNHIEWVNTSIRENKALMASLQKQIADLQKDLTENETQARIIESEIEHLKAQKLQVLTEIHKLEAEIELLCKQKQQVETELLTLEQGSRNSIDKKQQLESSIAGFEQELLELQREIASKKRLVEILTEEISNLENEIEIHTGERLSIQARSKEIQTKRQYLIDRIQGTERERLRLLEKIKDVKQKIGTTKREHQELQQRYSDLSLQLREVQSREKILDDISKSAADMQPSVREIMRASASGVLGGILGPVGNLISVPAELETAIEAAIGTGLQNVITLTWQDAEKAIEWLKMKKIGRVTFLPIDTVTPLKASHIPNIDGVVGIASELISYPEQIDRAISYMLGRILVVRDLGTARQVLPSARGVSSIVTLEGEVVRQGGAVTGGNLSKAQGGILAKRRELKESRERIREIGQKLEEVKDQAHKLDNILQTLRQEEDSLTKDLSQLEQSLLREKGSEKSLEDQCKLLKERLDWVEQQIERLQRRLNEANNRLPREKEQLHKLTEREKDIKARINQEREALGEYESSIFEMEANLLRLSSSLETIDRELVKTTHNLHENKARIIKIDSEVASRQSELDDIHGRIECLSPQVSHLTKQLDVVSKQISSLQEKIDEDSNQIESLRESLITITNQIASSNNELSSLNDSLQDACTLLEHLERQKSDIIHACQRETGKAPSTDIQISDDLGDLIKKIEQSRQKIARIGPVNPLAIEEYNQVRDRVDFLESQLRDISKAKHNLEDLINRLEHEMQQAFRETFQEVSQTFAEYFDRLFGGGKAGLKLAKDDKDKLGVEIEVQLPGKRVSTLSALSGGERALCSCALLLALIKDSKAPFCVMDEVDAALDERNVTRFCDLLEELASDTQFIVITHNRFTVERASRIFGVTQDKQGVSNVLSVRMEDYLAADKAS